jgi:NADP-dependent 3-hydroxy acid dehydrogenase YdfG
MSKRLWLGAVAGGALFGWWATRGPRGQSLRGRVAVVAGATGGLAQRIATRLAEAGCSLAICAPDLHEVKLAGLRLAGQGTSVMARRVDAGDPLAFRAFLDEVEAHFGRIDILVNEDGGIDSDLAARRIVRRLARQRAPVVLHGGRDPSDRASG